MIAMPSAEDAYVAVPNRTTISPDGEPPRRFIEWRPVDDHTWMGLIGVDRAGVIERSNPDFLVRDWAGEEVGRYASLDEAMLTLEPHVRALARHQAEVDAQLPLLARLVGWMGLCATVLAAIGLLFFMPQ